MIFEVQDTGEFLEIQDDNFTPDEESVYIFISDRLKHCFIWFGLYSGVRRQFIAANEGRKIKLDTGYRTSNVQHDDTTTEFEEALAQWKKDIKTGYKPSKILIEQRTRIQEMQKKQKRRVKAKKKEISIKKRSLPKDSEIRSLLLKLAQYEPLEDHIRDYIASSGYLYNVSEDDEGQLIAELLDEVKDGVFLVKNYLPRFIIEDSRLLAIELWRVPS
jgi:hypothetical protein